MNQQSSRNDPCPCGSGKKYKKCCGLEDAVHRQAPQAELGQLIALFHAGRYSELEIRAHLLLERYPNLGMAWKILGTALGIQGKNALLALQQAARFSPNDAEVHYNLGLTLQSLGQVSDAVASYRRALALKPNDANAHNDLGNALQELGRYAEAVNSYHTALALNPQFVEAHNKLGCVLHDLGQLDDAVASYQRALALSPNNAEVHNNLGFLLQELGQPDGALVSYRQALALDPEYAVAHNNLGNALQELGQYKAAVTSFQRALDIKPDYAEVYYNLGNVLQELGKPDAALASYQRALALKPNFAKAHNNLGNVLKDLGQFTDAVASFRRALEISPDFAGAHNNLGTVDDFRKALTLKPDYVEARSNLLFALNYTTGHGSTACLKEACVYGQIVAQNAKPFTTWSCAAHPQRLRIGLVSGDLCNHPVGYVLENLLERIDPAQLELIAYPTSRKIDELTTRIQRNFVVWKPIYGKNDDDAAQLIHADGVHILLDLSGHTAYNRLPVFARKPAPVQASWLGYFATTGVAEMDYLMTSEVAAPQAHRAHFTEDVWYLPDIWLCFTPPQQELPITVLPACANGCVTFACFQRLDKISNVALSAWGRILAVLPNARLRLANKQLGSQEVADDFKQRLQQHGIDAARVQLQGSAGSRTDYLMRYAEVDVMLDTFPYPGVTTTCEALWMGVPTLTLAGDTLLSRQGAGIVTPAGLSDWVAMNEEEYVTKAIQFASDLRKLAALRVGLRQQVLASPVFDSVRFARNFEAALWGMWRKYQGLEIPKNEPM